MKGFTTIAIGAITLAIASIFESGTVAVVGGALFVLSTMLK